MLAINILLSLQYVSNCSFRFGKTLMFHIRLILFLGFLFGFVSNSTAQVSESPIKLFGYFQTQFSHQDHRNQRSSNSFNMQQMNIFAQKDLGKNWTALVNLEFLNTYSSGRFWGSFNLEEAWVRYRVGKRLNLKLGLQIPIFNNLNEINNRMPLLPYIIRPLAYETSFGEFLDIESFTPKRTFIQAYGYFPQGDLKIDYALYIGNSPNITSAKTGSNKQSGVDSTNTFLVGGRSGIRFGELKAGFSFTYDVVTQFGDRDTLIGLPSTSFDEINRYRLGADLSYSYKDLSFEAEFIKVILDDNFSEIDFDKMFYYGTISYPVSDGLLAYITYTKTEENSIVKFEGFPSFEVNVNVLSVGASYDFNDRIRLKAQYGGVKASLPERDDKFNYYSAAVSVFF